MAYIVAATYRTKAGEEEAVSKILSRMAALSREEPGCLFYQALRSPEDPRVFFLYEQYVDENGYKTHLETDHSPSTSKTMRSQGWNRVSARSM